MVLDDKLNESIRDGMESIFYIIGGLVIMNYVYYGIFLVVSIVAFVILYRILKEYLRVTIPIVQQRERARIKVIEYYMKTQERMISFRGIGKAKIYEFEWIKLNNHYQNCMTHIMNHN
jgi:ABC-type multidrug transport system fused ATPase/permease subunit